MAVTTATATEKKEMTAEDLIEAGRCPECGSNLIHQGGCMDCPCCGWSACG